MNAEQCTTHPTPRFASHDLADGQPFPRGRHLAHLGPYRIEREIGRGGMGHVYLAVRDDRAFQKRVAIKVLRLGHQARAMEWRFKSERQILATLDHPNIARLIDGGTTDDGRPYFVMDYIEGLRIDRYCDEHRLTVKERLQLFLQVCDAVQYAHRNLVVHRDIKPSNLLVTADGTLKLLDFGIAKLLTGSVGGHGPNPALEETVTGQHPMTPKYASPEQIRGQAITTASDVYSLGVLLYKLLIGRVPRQPHVGEPLTHRRHTEPTSLSQAIFRVPGPADEPPQGPVGSQNPVGSPGRFTPQDSDSSGVSRPETIGQLRRTSLPMLKNQLSGDLDRITMMALRLEPERRYGSVEQLAEDIRRHLDGRPVSARADSVGYQCRKFFERHRWGVSAGAVVCSVLLLLFALMIQQTRSAVHDSADATAQRNVALAERDRSEALTNLWIDTLVDESGRRPEVTQEFVQRSLERLEGVDLAPEDRLALKQRLQKLRQQLPCADCGEETPP